MNPTTYTDMEAWTDRVLPSRTMVLRNEQTGYIQTYLLHRSAEKGAETATITSATVIPFDWERIALHSWTRGTGTGPFHAQLKVSASGATRVI